MDIGTTIGQRIVFFRELKGWKQKQLREAAGIKQSRMSKIEGDHAVPNHLELERISIFLEQPLEYFGILRKVVWPPAPAQGSRPGGPQAHGQQPRA